MERMGNKLALFSEMPDQATGTTGSINIKKRESGENVATINGRRWKVVNKPDLIQFCSICQNDQLAYKSLCSVWQHNVCAECEPKILANTKRCPTCNQDPPEKTIIDNNNQNISRQLNNVELECLECNKGVAYRDIDKHLIHCQETVQRCQNAGMGCDYEGYCVDLDSHQLSCQYKPVDCPNGCGKDVATLNLDRHKRRCRKRKVTEGGVTTTYEDMKGIKRIKRKFEQQSTKQLLKNRGKEKKHFLLSCQKYLPLLANVAFSRPSASSESKKMPCHWGCGDEFESSQLRSSHQEECPLRLLSCEYHCGATLPYNAMYLHGESCTHKLVPCPHDCGEQVPRMDLTETNHYRACTKFPVSCKYCSESIPRSQLKHHKFTECDRFTDECTMCSVPVPVYKIDSHEAECQIAPKLTVGSLHLSRWPDATGPAYINDAHGNYKYANHTVYFVVPTQKMKDHLQSKIQIEHFEISKNDDFIMHMKKILPCRFNQHEHLEIQMADEAVGRFANSRFYYGEILSFKNGKEQFSLKNMYDYTHKISKMNNEDFHGVLKSAPIMSEEDFRTSEIFDDPYCIIRFRFPK